MIIHNETRTITEAGPPYAALAFSSFFSSLPSLPSLLFVLAALRRRLFPVGLEHLQQLARNRRVVDDQTDLTPFFQLALRQALAADEHVRAVPHDRAHVLAHRRQLVLFDAVVLALDRAKDTDRDALG